MLLSVVGRELSAPFCHLIYTHSSKENNPALKDHKEFVHKARRTDSTRQNKEPKPSFILEAPIKGKCSINAYTWRELELWSEDIFHIGKGMSN